MKDFNDTLVLDNDDRIASGTLTVTDYEALIGAKSGGTITVNSYAELIGVKAASTITITAFASLAGKTVTIGAEVLTEGVDFTAETSNDVTATNLAAAIDGLAEVAAAAVGAVVTVTAAAFGVAGNAIGMSTNAAAGITLAEAHLIGGKEHGTITVGADTLVQGTDFTAETSNNVTATNIAAAIDGLADYAASAALAVVTIEAAAIGAAYNVELSATWNDLADTAVTLSGSMLTGGLDEGTVTLGATVLTQGADFTAETNNNTTATNIAAALDAIADFGAAAVGAVVTVTADAAGTAGNVAFSSNSTGVTIVAMSGGADYFYSDVFDYAKEKNPSITLTPNVTVLSGGGNVVAVVEVSMNKVDWETLYTFPTFYATGSATKTLTRKLNYARLKVSVTGTATVTLKAMTSEFAGDEGTSLDKVSGVDLTPGNPLPVERVDDASVATAVSGETLVWYFLSTGAWAAAVGEAAGTICTGKLGYTGLLNSLKSALGCASDTSFALAVATRFDALVTVPDTVFSSMVSMTPTAQKAEISKYLVTNGQYAIDHRRGQIWGKAKAIVANDSASYSYMTPVQGSSAAGNAVDVTKVGGVAVPTVGADGVSNTRTDVPTSARLSGFNGATWDRLRAGITAVTATLTGWLNTLPWAVYNATPTVRTEGQGGPLQADANGNLKVAEQFEIPGGDSTADVMKVEQRFSSSGNMTSDTQIKGSAGFIHTLTFSCADAVPTAGSFVLYDNTAESGTVLFSWAIPATYFAPFTITLDVSAANGLYAGFTTTNDVNVVASYR